MGIKKIIPVALRKFTYPYKCCVSICSDIDFTDNLAEFRSVQSFMKNEIGIKFSNNFLPFHNGGKFSLFSNNIEDGKAIIKAIKEGEIDGIHSYGEKDDFSREDAIKVIEELKKEDCNMYTWIDHAYSPSNLCKYRMFGKGDMKGEREYHFDLTKKYGIKYIWTDRLTAIIGQEAPITLHSFLELYDSKYKIDSLKGILTTFVKVILGNCGVRKFIFFKNNSLVRAVNTKDGQKIYEFIRFNNHFKGANVGDSFEDLYYMISPKVLDSLKKKNGYSIVYVHLGKNFNTNSANSQKTIEALRNLCKEQSIGNICVERTSKILDYYVVHRFLKWNYSIAANECKIYIDLVEDPIFGSYVPAADDLQGITFYIPEDKQIRIFIRDKELNNFRINPSDYIAKKSVTIIDAGA